LLFGACGDPFSPLVPKGAFPFDPPAQYAPYWRHMEDCLQVTGDLSRVKWFRVPGSTFDCPNGGRCDGLWVRPHTIYLAYQRMNDSLLVEHEMLHDLLQRGDHPAAFQTCGVP